MARWWRSETRLPAAVDSPASPQMVPFYWRPEWYVGHLVYQGGVPVLKASSLTGGGFLPMRDGFAGKFTPSYQDYQTPLTSQVGSGTMPSRPNFLTMLFGGRSTTGQN